MSGLAIAQSALLSLLVAYAAWSDIRCRKIPNLLAITTAVTGLLCGWIGGSVTDLGWQFAHFAAALALGMALFAAGWWGGGDGKFYAGVAAWVPLQEFPKLAVSIALSGLVLVLVLFFIGRATRKKGTTSGTLGDLPYGVAIGAGALLTVLPGLLAR